MAKMLENKYGPCNVQGQYNFALPARPTPLKSIQLGVLSKKMRHGAYPQLRRIFLDFSFCHGQSQRMCTYAGIFLSKIEKYRFIFFFKFSERSRGLCPN